jgi:phenylacetate-CoA ligase
MRELLANVLERASRTPFYRSHGWSVETWDEIPLTTKSDLRDAYPFGLLAVPREKLASYHESSGTSGEPTSSFLTEADWDDIAERFGRNAVDLRPGDAVLVKTPYSLLTTAHQMHRAARLKGALVVPADNRSALMPYTKVIRLLRDLPITVAWCMPTEALLWAESARLQGYDPATDFPALRAFVVAGEPLSQAKRRRIERLWNCKVYQDYGSTETGSLGGECSKGNLHLWADRIHFEVVDRGLVVTPLYREAMPLVRYALEDAVRLEEEKCECGWRWPVARILGRKIAQGEVQGRGLFPAELEEMVYGLPEELGVSFWRARHDRSRLEVQIESPAQNAREAEHLLAHRVAESTGIICAVRGVPPGTLVSREILTGEARFAKPKFLFDWNENWDRAIITSLPGTDSSC